MQKIELVPFSSQCQWKISENQSIDIWQDLMGQYLKAIAKACESIPGSVIGHIKAFAKLPKNGYLQSSVIDSSHSATGSVMERTSIDYSILDFTLNVLVYGLSFRQAEKIVIQSALEVSEQTSSTLSISEVFKSVKHNHFNVNPNDNLQK